MSARSTSATPGDQGRRAARAATRAALVAALLPLTAAAPAEAVAVPARADGIQQPTAVGGEDRLGEADRELLAEAVAAGKRSVTLLLATGQGDTERVASGLRGLGAVVSVVEDRLGYVRATVPTGAVARAVGLPDVVAVDLNGLVERPDPDAERGRRVETAVPAPGAGTPRANPYLPTQDTGAAQFVTANPQYDGRGTTVGVLDSGVDLDHPALQTTSTGERKIADWVTATDPVVDRDGTWRPMRTAVSGESFSYAGATWTAPDGDLLVDRFAEAVTRGSEPAGDVNRDGDTDDVFGVLLRPSDGAVWVDTDQDRDFTDGPALRPYAEAQQVGRFGTDRPETELVESMPFVVEVRSDVDLAPAGRPGQRADFVNIGIVESGHGSHVAGIAAGRALFGGEVDGAAPGARIVSSRACTWGGGCTSVALVEGMIDLVLRREVDVVNMSIGGLPALNDGANARAELYDRLVDDFGVQIFTSAGNSGPGMNTVGDPSVAGSVVSVGSSISKQTWRADYGAEVRLRQGLHPYSARGPREDGGKKPDLVAPGAAVSTVPRWLAQPGLAEVGYRLPVGYAMFNGTSMSSPQAAGAAALLLSEARAQGRTVTTRQLRTAMTGTARFLGKVPAYAQGSGLLDVERAARLLRRGVDTGTYTVSAPVCTELSGLLRAPGRGAGIYDRCAADEGGAVAGRAKTYDVVLTRTSGLPGVRPHTVTWRGDDGTFRAPRSVALPLGVPVTVRVTGRPARAGAHSALLRLDDPGTRGLDLQVLATVVAGVTPTAPSYATRASGEVQRAGTTSVFVTVPEGAEALQVDLSGVAAGSQTRFIAIDPYGIPADSTASSACFTNRPVAGCEPLRRAYEDPVPGVWEIEVEARRTSPLLDNPFRVTASVLGVRVAPEQVVVPSARRGRAVPVAWTVTNAYGPTTVTPEGGPLGSARTLRPSIATGRTQTYDVVVPEGATRLSVRIGDPSDRAADLDLYVLKDGALVGYAADGDSEEAVELTDPEPGTYVVEVDGYDVPAGTTTYELRDVFLAPALGSLAVAGGPVRLPTGGSTRVTGTLTARAVPAAGRQLSGELVLRGPAGAALGRGSVVVRAVR